MLRFFISVLGKQANCFACVRDRKAQPCRRRASPGREYLVDSERSERIYLVTRGRPGLRHKIKKPQSAVFFIAVKGKIIFVLQ
ncbi:MAG: hypothetical protein A3B07_02400 [Candidatus Yonathbacteria bacterium RIFCSPLOWO2_01_FULL_43_27]|uniref:Uncharacterized protein n=1 Tax=Candidatus Yonathbacteria bacterium RIFCSPLOWO2_01_FULL_43_27 TaxID=1802726 RepID=A0A1G2SCF4_9BACT|nr:MAG: hypothetical protein A3B07_02400 [Candidatus Yonathbacteria bacterium RIFCSPLOWO2_01_FULL_43_27]